MTNPFYIKFCYVLNLTKIHRQVTHKIRWNTFYCIPDVTSKTNRLKNYALPKRGFITSTDHRPTNQSAKRPPTHWPTDPIIADPTDKILFQRRDQWRIFILQNANSWEDKKLYFGLLSIWWIDIFLKSLFIFRKYLSLVFFKRKLLFCIDIRRI